MRRVNGFRDRLWLAHDMSGFGRKDRMRASGRMARIVEAIGLFKSARPAVFARFKRTVHRTVVFSLGAETRRVLASALGLGRRRKRVWHHANSTPTSSSASERPQGQA